MEVSSVLLDNDTMNSVLIWTNSMDLVAFRDNCVLMATWEVVDDSQELDLLAASNVQDAVMVAQVFNY